MVYRVAAMLSLRRNGFLDDRPDDIDSNAAHPVRLPGVIEMSSNANPLLLFPTIVQIIANRQLDLEEIYEQIWYHIHLGCAIVGNMADQAADFPDFYTALLKEIPTGLETSGDLRSYSARETRGIRLTLGIDREGNNSSWRLNDTTTVENPHACIIGLSGQGKTQFVLDLLHQLREQNTDITFTILDYKGDLSEDGSATTRLFEHHLQCGIVVPGVSRIPAVPFQKPQALDREQYALGVTDLISRFYPQLGSQQRLALREVLADVMSHGESSEAFGFEILGERLEEFYREKGRREDGLTEVVSRLRVLQLFEETPSQQNSTPLLNGSLLVRLNELAADTLPAAFLLIRACSH